MTILIAALALFISLAPFVVVLIATRGESRPRRVAMLAIVGALSLTMVGTLLPAILGA